MPEITTWTKLAYPVAVRGELATKLFEAAAELGFDVSTIKAQSDGFKVPTEVAEYLFPSGLEDRAVPDPAPVFPVDSDDNAEVGVPIEPEPEPTETVADEIAKTSSPRAGRAPRPRN